MRWQPAQGGLVLPRHLIPVAEETGLMLPMGRWVLAEACRQLRAWQEGYAGASALSIAVNLSARQLQDPALLDEVAAVLRTTGLRPACLLLEITEGVVMQEIEMTIDTLAALRALGVRLAIDDFGTGYFSVRHLQRLPVDVLKIDQAFVTSMDDASEDAGVARTIIQRGQTLGLQTVAKGIEEAGQLASLRTLGCHLGQGHYFARPLPADGITALLRQTADNAVYLPAGQPGVVRLSA